MAHEIEAVIARQRRLLRGLVIALVAVTLGFGVLLAVYFADRSDEPWSPLAKYPVQEVLNEGGAVLPVDAQVQVGQQVVKIPANTVAIVARKCNASTESFTVKGESRWQLLSPAGLGRFENAPGQRSVAPRECVVKTPTDPYLNLVPQEVLDRAATICVITQHPTTWNINGEDTPHSGDKTGTPQLWRTEPFQIGCG